MSGTQNVSTTTDQNVAPAMLGVFGGSSTILGGLTVSNDGKGSCTLDAAGGQNELILVEHGNFGPPPYFFILQDAQHKGADGVTFFLGRLA